MSRDRKSNSHLQRVCDLALSSLGENLGWASPRVHDMAKRELSEILIQREKTISKIDLTSYERPLK
jgi:hypothetical protein